MYTTEGKYKDGQTVFSPLIVAAGEGQSKKIKKLGVMGGLDGYKLPLHHSKYKYRPPAGNNPISLPADQVAHYPAISTFFTGVIGIEDFEVKAEKEDDEKDQCHDAETDYSSLSDASDVNGEDDRPDPPDEAPEVAPIQMKADAQTEASNDSEGSDEPPKQVIEE